MASLSYETIFSNFLGNVTDFNIASLNISDAYEMMTEYLRKGLAQTYIRRLFSRLVIDDEIQTLEFEMEYKVDDEQDMDFVINILAKAMVIEWLKPQVRNKLNTMQLFGTKEQKFFSQQSHLSELRGLLEDTQLEVRKEIRDRGYIYNAYIG